MDDEKIYQKKKNNLRNSFLLVILSLFLYAILWGVFFQSTLDIVDANNRSESIVIVGNVPPNVTSVIIENGDASIYLIAGGNKSIQCNATIVDWNGDTSVSNATSIFWHSGGTTLKTASDDNNNHYSNTNCTLDYSYGDTYTLTALCQFNVTYYANNGTWTCSVNATDNTSLSSEGYDNISVEALLAVNIPNTIHYGTVNALAVSNENITNVTNWGNVDIDLNVEGYGWVDGDGLAMRCTLGNIANISLHYEKYNLSASTLGALNFSQFNSTYIELTDTAVLNPFNLNQRQDDNNIDNATKQTYWRVYVPLGVAGTCNGTVLMGAVYSNS